MARLGPVRFRLGPGAGAGAGAGRWSLIAGTGTTYPYPDYRGRPEARREVLCAAIAAA